MKFPDQNPNPKVIFQDSTDILATDTSFGLSYLENIDKKAKKYTQNDGTFSTSIFSLFSSKLSTLIRTISCKILSCIFLCVAEVVKTSLMPHIGVLVLYKCFCDR